MFKVIFVREKNTATPNNAKGTVRRIVKGCTKDSNREAIMI
ncbi:unnamed protein product [marine sediment metagenome]|uniref:Uncharacterized protein n=1 Tax=marine sediment metagenome TaxID=412755 RepID=X1N7J6_9ZZZZ